MKLIRAWFRDPLFWLLLADYILTLFVIKTGSWIEANPLVVWLWNWPAFIVEMFIYFVVVPKKNWWFVRIILVARYCFIIARHIIFLIW